MPSRYFVWSATTGGAWSNSYNWNDVTDGINPSLLAPGSADTAAIAGPYGAQIATITGPGSAASLSITGNVALAGSFTLGSLALGGLTQTALLSLGSGASLVAGSAALVTGSLLATGSATLSVIGTLTVGDGQSGLGFIPARLSLASGAALVAAALSLQGGNAQLLIDAASCLEIGGAHAPVAGALVVDPGASLAGWGQADAYGTLVNNGTIGASGGTLAVGALSGAGTLTIDAGATLQLQGTASAGQSVRFLAANATLALAAEPDAPAGPIAGFGVGDAIDFLGSPITGASWTSAGNGTGVLTAWYGTLAAARFTLIGDYGADVFLPSTDGAGGTLLTLAPVAAGGAAPAGTPTSDLYRWTATSSGAWSLAANWADDSAGQSPAVLAPGANDRVAITSAGDFAVIAGDGNAATLALGGSLAFTGAIADGGALTVGSAGPAAIDLLPGARLAAATGTLVNGTIALQGGAQLAIAGAFAMGGGPAGVGLPLTALIAASGARITLGGLSIGGGSGDALITDPTGSIEIGTLGNAAPGAVTIDAGALLAGNGSIDVFGSVIDNGTIWAQGGTLTLGAVSGTGTLRIADGACLSLAATCSLSPAFDGAAGTLLLGSEQRLPSAPVLNFAEGDVIDLGGSPLSSASWSNARNGTGTLTLWYGGSVAGTLLFTGSYNGSTFLTAPDGAGGTDILLVSNGGTGNAGGGANADALAWTTPQDGNWGRTANWTDLVTGQTAKSAPGASNPVTITGFTGGQLQTIGGPGSAASLLMLGNTALSGTFTVGTLTIGTDTQPGFLDLPGIALLSAGSGAVANGTLLVSGAGAGLSIAGTLALGGGAAGVGYPGGLLAAQAGGRITLGGLTLGGGSGDTVSTDTLSAIEIGTVGGAAAGCVTVDPGCLVSGSGSLQVLGTVIDNGAIQAAGGTLAVGAVRGTGTLSIGGEAALLLEAGSAVPIAFTGDGAVLAIAGTALPTGTVTGFAPGDLIDCTALAVNGLAWQPGTLTLSEGGTIIGRLALAGDYSADTFAVAPDGAGGSVIAVLATNGGGGPPAGTPTPDLYAWTGSHGTAWADPGNWNDLSAGQSPALVPPGGQNLVTIAGPVSGAFATVTGPANAASLAITGQVGLTGTFTAGSLTVGNSTSSGFLALGAGTVLRAGSAAAAGVVAVGGPGAALSVSGTLLLGGPRAGVLSVTGGGTLSAGGLVLAGSGDALATDALSSIEIGGAGEGTAAAVTIDPGAQVQGAGAINLFGQTVDRGVIKAAGGTLTLGQVSGGGTLAVGPGATLAIPGGAAVAEIDFDGAGTLTLTDGTLPTAALVDFGAGDAVVFAATAYDAVEYAGTDAGSGTLMLFRGGTEAGAIALRGVSPGEAFTIQPGANGGAVLTATVSGGSNNQGGGTMSGNGPTVYGGQAVTPSQFLAGQPTYVKNWIGPVIGNQTVYEYTAPSGDQFGPPNPFDYDVAIFAPQGGNEYCALPAGYRTLLIESTLPTTIDDGGTGNAVLVGASYAPDTIVASGQYDTLVGGLGSNTLFRASGNVTVAGGGYDTIETGIGNASVVTGNYASTVFLGPAQNLVQANGRDTIIPAAGDTLTGGGNGGTSYDTIYAGADPVLAFSPGQGLIDFVGGAGAYTVVGSATSNLEVTGGSGTGLVWGSEIMTSFQGGSGSAVVVAAGGLTQVQGGSGALTVFGGTGQLHMTGAAGNEIVVAGAGASTISAASGNQVFLVGGANCSLSSSGSGAVLAGIWSSGNDVYVAGTGRDTIWGGTGSDTMIAGSGNSLFVGSSGADLFSFTDGRTGGSDTVVGFSGADKIGLSGYPGGVAAALASQTHIAGSTQITLADGTEVLFYGVASLGAGNFA